MPSPFDRSMNYFGLPQTGVGQPMLSPQETAQVDWLNAGGNTPAPVAPISQDWDDEDWKIAALTGDPLGVKQMWDTYKGQQDEQAFIQGLGKIDWKSPGSRQKIGELVAQNPRGLSSEGMNYMRLMDSLMEPEVDKFEAEAAGYGAPYLQAYKTSRAAGKPSQAAFADAVSQRNADVAKAKGTKDTRAPLTGEPAKEIAGIMSEVFSSQNYEPTNEEKVLFLPKGVDPTKASSTDWSNAYYQARQKKQEEALNKLKSAQAVYGQIYKVPGTGPAGLQAAPSASPWPAEVSTTVGTPTGAVMQPAPTQIAPPTTASVPALPSAMSGARVPVPVSPADLNRVDQDAFAKLQSEISTGKTSESEASRLEREQEFVNREAKNAKDNELWETAKQTVLKNLSAQDLRNLITGGGMTSEGEMKTAILRATGKQYNEEAFTDASGKPRAWIEVFRALASDPRSKALFTTPSEKSPAKQSTAQSVPIVDRSNLWNKPTESSIK